MESILRFITVITAIGGLISGLVIGLLQIINMNSFEEIYTKKYKLTLYSIVKLILYVLFLDLLILYFSYCLFKLSDSNIKLYNFIKGDVNGILGFIFVISCLITLIPYLYITLNIPKLISFITKILNKMKFPKLLKSLKNQNPKTATLSKIQGIADKVFTLCIIISFLSFLLLCLILCEETIFKPYIINNIIDYNKILNSIIAFIIFSLIIYGFYIFLIYIYRGRILKYEAKFILGSICERKSIEIPLYVLDSKNEKELILGNKKTINDSDIIYLFNTETEKFIEFKKDTN